MLIQVENDQTDLSISDRSVIKAVKAFAKAENLTFDELTVYFVDVPNICKLHEEFFDNPSQTDCMSFPMDDADETYRILGEIFICPKTAIQYASRLKTRDAYEEVTLYLVHGLLHLIGYDDIDPADRKIMKEAEKKHLLALKKANLLLKM